MMKLLTRYLKKISGEAYRMNKMFFLESLEQTKNARILDLGCGSGEFSREIMGSVGAELYGIEMSKEHAKQACKNGVSVVIGNIDRGLPFKDNSFDIVVSNQVIEHVSSTDNFIKECYRVLSHEGMCIASTPNLASLHNIFSLVLGYQPFGAAVSDELQCGNPLDPDDGCQYNSKIRHRRVFTAPALRRLFEFHGFKVEELSGIGLHPLPLFLSRHIKWARYSLFLTIKARKLKR
jgi:SAM-dependent methyltransferase